VEKRVKNSLIGEYFTAIFWEWGKLCGEGIGAKFWRCVLKTKLIYSLKI